MKKIAILVALLTVSVAMSAQNFLSGYFLDDYDLSYRDNPAFRPQGEFRGGVSLTASSRTNVGLDKFLFPISGNRLANGLNQNVDARKFLDPLPELVTVNANVDVLFYTRGFERDGVYHTIDVSVRSDNVGRVPKSFFSFLKEGMANDVVYDFSDLDMRSSNYMEIAYGQSRSITDRLELGFRIKPLIGVSYANLNIDEFKMTSVKNSWMIQSKADINLAGNQFRIPQKTKDGATRLKLDGASFKLLRPAIAGLGLAADLGVAWHVSDDLTFSASALDLGFMAWFGKVHAETPSVEYVMDEGDMLDARGNAESSALGDVATFYVTQTRNYVKRLQFTLHAAAEYVLPANRDLSFGVLGTYRNSSLLSWGEGRFITNWKPLSWLSGNVSFAWNSFGPAAGMMLCFRTSEANIFIGTDAYVFKVTPQLIPAGKANITATIGAVFPL